MFMHIQVAINCLENNIQNLHSEWETRRWKRCIEIWIAPKFGCPAILEYPMLHTNLQGHQPSGSREEDFLRFLPYMRMAAILVDQDHFSKLSFPYPIEAPYEIWLWLAQWFLRRCLNCVDNDVLRTTTTWGLPISSPNKPSAQVS